MCGAKTLGEFCALLKKPRKVIVMVKAGPPVDETAASLLPFLEEGDIIVDGGNSHFKDTIRRTAEYAAKGIHFVGAGISGGEEGARNGPAIMPGGSKEAYGALAPILERISAHVGGDPCCAHMGPDGAGHFVKMVHNGIEYGDMQLICEAYDVLSRLLGLNAKELASVFSGWNAGELDSYLIEITKNIFTKYDGATGRPMVDVILDSAGQKGTGKWTSQEALDLGVPAPTIAEAVFARCASALKTERVAASKVLTYDPPPFSGDRAEFTESVRRALYASKICSYAQGFALYRAAAAEYGWDLDFGGIAMVFRGGCIIRARFLQKIKDAFDAAPGLSNLMLDGYFSSALLAYQNDWRKVVSAAVSAGISTPAFSSALSYFDAYRAERLPANLLQAQRDYFGAHTFERVDAPGDFHFEWL